MRRPNVQDLAWLRTIPQSSAVVRASRSVQTRVSAELPFRPVSSFDDIPAGAGTLIVSGGGSLMDQAKYFRARVRPALRLVLIPSIWGSGAEASPIAVLNCEGSKEIAIGDEFLPDAVVYWPELLATVSPHRRAGLVETHGLTRWRGFFLRSLATGCAANWRALCA